MIAREYNKRIQLKVYTDAPDGFGGNIAVDNEQMYDLWAKLVNPSSNRATDLGISDLYNSLVFRVRYSDLFVGFNSRQYLLSYGGKDYTVAGIVDVDQFHRELEITCSAQINSNPVG